jgi:HSP20 family molecular chaperone IbpA
MSAMRTMGLAPILPQDATVTRTAREYVVSLAVPGFAQQELEVELADHFVTIRGDQARTTTDRGSFKLHERIEESFGLPADVDTDRVSAVYKNRSLEIHAPRISTRTTPRRVPITRPSAFNCDASGV